MLRLLDAILEGAPQFLCMNNSRTHANGNKVRRAQAADHDPASIACVNIMAEPIESPENTSVEVVALAINDIIESMMPRHASNVSSDTWHTSASNHRIGVYAITTSVSAA